MTSTAAEETVRFAVDGVEYEVDLSKQHAVSLRKALDEYMTKGRCVGGRAKLGEIRGDKLVPDVANGDQMFGGSSDRRSNASVHQLPRPLVARKCPVVDTA